ncbi:MAG: glycosyltransferase family 2 protein [Flavobacteriales bacterium]|nr:glycosyltransferase family 2 protein [Flavobacteriales bacterium]
MMQTTPLPSTVSVVVPCRNEERFIEDTLKNIVSQDYPVEFLEVLLIDGMSTDGTRGIIKTYCQRYEHIRSKDNSGQKISFALNIGIRASTSEYIVRMDVHSSYPTNYISRLINAHQELQADNVGGVWLTRPSSNTIQATSIALALGSKFGVGGADYRVGVRESKQVDTVPFGCYKREIFEQIGYFDESLNRNQDDEFNGRLIKNGGVIYLIPEIKITYYPRETLVKLWRMFYEYGYEKPFVNKKLGKPFTLRQLVPPLFILALVFSLILAAWDLEYISFFIVVATTYMLVNFATSLYTSLKNPFSSVIMLPLAFWIIHTSYGISYLKGCIDYLILGRQSGVNESAHSR